MAEKNGEHFVLVHGAGSGSWVWYKVKQRLEAAGHRVTVVDLAASGQHSKAFSEVHTFNEYNEPLMEVMSLLQENEKVILVGHSLGGMSLAIAMEKYPHKISVAVFVNAVLPDTSHHPAYIFEKLYEISPPTPDDGVDNEISWQETINGPMMWVHFGTKYMATKIYTLSPVEDLELGKILHRPASFFISDLAKTEKLTDEKYGSVNRVYIVCDKDQILKEEVQRWAINFSGIDHVIEINGSDHMPMISKPQELYQHLIEVADKYT
ncbi:methyl esterase 1 [Euphorbia peplus]|nr:methyl esterase 1 [Euphorbia peplus]